MTATEASTVLVLFVKALGGSNFLAGLLPSLRFFGWLMPQFYVAGRLQKLSHMLPAVRLLEAGRYVAYFAMAGLAFAYGATRPELVLVLFFALYLLTRVAAGSSAVARAELVGGLVPPEERSTVVSVRLFAGGVAGFVAGFIVRFVLDERVADFPTNYALLLLISAMAFLVAVVVLSAVREPARSAQGQETGVRQQLQRAPELLGRDRRLALFVGVRAAVTGFEMAAPFYVVYATERLGAPAALAGIYISMRTLARVVSNLYWGRRCRRAGSLGVVRIGLAIGVMAPVTVLGFMLLGRLGWDGGVPTVAAWAFGLVFLLDGLAVAALGVGRMSYLYEIAPEGYLPTYFGLANTLLGPLYFLPALGGALVDRVGFVPIFGAAAGLLTVGYALATRLERVPEPAWQQETMRERTCDAAPAGEQG